MDGLTSEVDGTEMGVSDGMKGLGDGMNGLGHGLGTRFGINSSASNELADDEDEDECFGDCGSESEDKQTRVKWNNLKGIG